MEAARKRDEATGDPSSDTGFIGNVPAPASLVPMPKPDTKFFTKHSVRPDSPRVDSAHPDSARPEGLESATEPKPEVAEMLVCSVQGDIIYDWECPDPNGRVSFLEFISQRSRQLGIGLGLGDFERLEIISPRSRVIAQMQGEHAIIVRTNLLPQATAA
jgi:hypothetical protein